MPPETPPVGGRRHLVIAGSYGMRNAGDEAILEAVLEQARQALPGVEAVVVTGDPDGTARSHGVTTVSWSDWPSISEAVAGAEALLLGGGGLFFDYGNFSPDRLLEAAAPDLNHYASFGLVAEAHGTPLVIHACGVGPLRTEASRDAIASVFRTAAVATVRDPASAELVAGTGAPEPEVTADAAFTLPAPSDESAAEAVKRAGLDPARPLICVAPRDLTSLTPGGAWLDEVVRAAASVALEAGAQVAVLTFHEGFDSPAVTTIAERLQAQLPPGDVVAVEASSGSSNERALIAGSDLVLAGRLHAAIFAAVAGRPFVGLAYAPKVRDIAALVHQQDVCVDLESTGLLAEAMRRAWTERETRAATVAAAAAEQRTIAQRSTARLAQAVQDHPARGREARLAGAALTARLRELKTTAEAREWAMAEIERQQQSAEALREQVAAEQQRVAAVEATLTRAEEASQERQRRLLELGDELQAASAELERTRYERDVALQQRTEYGQQLDELRNAVTVRLVFRLWTLTGRHLPEGSSRRKALRVVRRGVERSLNQGRTTSGLASGPASPQESSFDVVAGLLALERWADQQGADKAVLLLSATQLRESEGQRPTNLALRLAARGIPVIFAYWRWTTSERMPEDRTDSGILQIPIDMLLSHPGLVVDALPSRDRVALFEFPYPGFFEVLAALNTAGWTTVYDVLDDWEEFHRVGQAIWYDRAFEEHLLAACDVRMAINRPLADRMSDLSPGQVAVNGNALKPGVEHASSTVVDLPRGEVTVGYFGHLTAAWFDWELLAEAARRRPTWRWYLIGYGEDWSGSLPDNVVLLGKKPQSELASYAALWDVALVPFKPDRLAECADPIKTYEYLSMGLPVVVTGVHPPPGAEDLVLRTEGVEPFLAAVAAAAADVESQAARRAYARGATWDHRLDEMFQVLSEQQQRLPEKRFVFGG